MALNIEQVHKRVSFLIRKNRWGYVSPEEIDIALDMAQLDLFNEYYGNENKYQYGRPIPPMAYGQTGKTTDPIYRFVEKIVLNETEHAVPDDFVHLDSAFITYLYSPPVDTPPPDDNQTTDEEIGVDPVGGDPVDDGSTTSGDQPIYITKPLPLISSDKRAFRMNSQLLPISNGLPDHAFIAFDIGDGGGRVIKVYPEDLDLNSGDNTVFFYYIHTPAPPKFAYTQTGRTVEYDTENSVQLNWSDDDIKKIIAGAIQYIGINQSNPSLFQAGQIKSKE